MPDEAISAPGDRFNVARIIGGIREGDSQFSYRNIDGLIEVAKAIVGPNAGSQFFSGYNLSRLFQQDLQQFERLLLKFDPDTRFAEFSRAKVDLVGTKSHDGRGPKFFHGPPSPPEV